MQNTLLAGFFLLRLQGLSLTVTRKTILPPGGVVLKDHHMNERQIVQHMIMGLPCLEVQLLNLEAMLEYYEKYGLTEVKVNWEKMNCFAVFLCSEYVIQENLFGECHVDLFLSGDWIRNATVT